jgi:hypothetical protein
MALLYGRTGHLTVQNGGVVWPGQFIVWRPEHGFHGQQVIKLTFDTPQAITGAEL